MVLYSPRQQPLQWRLCSSCVTRHSSKSNLIGPKQQLSLSVQQYPCSCLPLSLLSSSHSVSIDLFYLSLSHSSLSLLCLLSLDLSGPFRHSNSNSGKIKNPLNVQPNSWKMRKQLLYTRKLRWCSETVKCSYAKMSSSVSHLYSCTGELCTGCNRKHSSYAFHSTELKREKRLLQAV